MAKALQALLEERIDPLLEWDAAAIEAALRAFAEAAGWEAKDVFMTVRVAPTGRAATPPLFETLAVLGKEIVPAAPAPGRRSPARREAEAR